MGVGAGLYMYDVVVNKFTVASSSPDEFLSPVVPCGSSGWLLVVHHTLFQCHGWLSVI